jgi:signal transduction histidine kinase
MTRKPEDGTILRIVLREMRAAPLRLRFFMGLTGIYVFGMSAWALYEKGWESFFTASTLGAYMGAASGVLIGFSFALFTLAQEGHACSYSCRIRLRTHRMHPMLLALPVLCFISGILAVAALCLIVGRVSLTPMLLAGVPTAFVIWLALHGLRVTTRFLYDHAREQAELAARAREEATRSQLAALQAQLNPHFLFNSLNTVASLVRTDPRRAEATVENLARILRRTLDRSAKSAILLSDELDYLRAYLSIEQERYGSRLAVDWNVDPAALGLLVPPMTLQPLVENSLKHGLSKKLEGGHVRIAVSRRNGTLLMQVDDDGPGFARDARDGTGLGNLRQRLATLYGGAASVRVNGARGASVTLEIPAESSG